MKTNFTRLVLFTVLFLTFLSISAQDAYRTNFASNIPSKQWTDAANWERFDAGTSTWVTATAYPTASTASTITIQAGDSLQLSGSAYFAIDEVVVETGGILVIFNQQANGGQIDLHNGPGDDVSVNGRLYVAGGATVYSENSPGSNIRINSGGLFVVRNSALMYATLINDGTMHMGSPGVSAGTLGYVTVTNNGNCYWIDGNANLRDGGTFINNGNLYIATTGTPNWLNTAGGGGPNTIVNNGSIIKTNSNTVNIAPAFSNTGTIGGIGAFGFTTFSSNTGILSPGTSPGILTVPATSITGKSPKINIEITGTGNVPGTDNDQIIIPTAVSVSGTTLNVTNTGTAPAGTVYTIMNTTAGNITGTFLAINKPSNFSVTYNANSITLTKIALFPLPVAWGEFKALAQGNRVLLDWTTMMESNTSHFVIEYSTNSSTFSPIANVEAQGNSTYEARYKYTFATPDLSRTNYFRIKQVDLDGKSTYSLTRSVKFDKGQVVAIQAYPNPVKDVLTLNIQKENIQVLLADQSGKTIQRLNVQPGQHSINMQTLPTGIYQLAVFENGVRIETKQIMKQ